MSNSDTLFNCFRLGLNTNNEKFGLYTYGRLKYKNFYAYSYPRFVSDINAFPRFSGLARDKKRLGLESFEIDQSGVGYQNKNFIFQYGRGRLSWGAGENIQLPLSEESPPYDYGYFSFNYNKLKFAYFHGYLEKYQNWNRYITGRGIEYNNRKNLILSLSEIIIYSGDNRPFDISYLNPLIFHFEIEMNNRQNNLDLSDGSANAVWQISIDHLIKSKLRLSYNFLIDELVIDKVERDSGKAHGFGSSFRCSYDMRKHNDHILTTFFSMIAMGTHTLRHDVESNNFVNRYKPIGWQGGSDTYQLSIGINYYNKRNFIISTELINQIIGEESIIENPYYPYQNFSNYLSTSFPSGDKIHMLILKSKMNYWFKENIALVFEFDINKNNKNDKMHYQSRIKLDYFIQINNF